MSYRLKTASVLLQQEESIATSAKIECEEVVQTSCAAEQHALY